MNQESVKKELLKIIAQSDDGMSITEILKNLSVKLARRTLQRILSELVSIQKIIKVGAGRGVLYQVDDQNYTDTPVEELKTNFKIRFA